MAKKRRGKQGSESGESGDTPVLPKLPERMASPFRDALGPLKKQLESEAKQAQEAQKAKEAAKKAPLRPPPPHSGKPKKHALQTGPEMSGDEATALSLAMQGVVPLGDKHVGRVGVTTPTVKSRTAKVAPFGTSAEDKARERLDALVAQDVRFRVAADSDYVEGSRIDAHPRVLRELCKRTRAAETLDLHGFTGRQAEEELASFVRKAHRKGLDILCVVHGKGQHSEGGQGVLRDVVVKALTGTGAATRVLAFVTAPDALGGSGALLVQLKH